MAKAKTTKTDAAASARKVNIDRVAMPSLGKDGTYDQTEDFQIVGDKEGLLEVEKERQRQFHVSAVDQDLRGVTAGSGILAEDREEGTAEDTPQDPSIEKLEKAHKAAEAEGEKVAEALVNEHFTENPDK